MANDSKESPSLVKDHLVLKVSSIHDIFSTNKNAVKPNPEVQTAGPSKKVINSKNDESDALHFIDYAKERGYSLEELLKFDISSAAAPITR